MTDDGGRTEDRGWTLLTTCTLTGFGTRVLGVVTCTLILPRVLTTPAPDTQVTCSEVGVTGFATTTPELVSVLLLAKPNTLENLAAFEPNLLPVCVLPLTPLEFAAFPCPLSRLLLATEKRLCRLRVLNCATEALGTVSS